MLENGMRLSHELRRELEERLSTIDIEQETDPAYRDLPAIDEWIFRLLILAGIVAIVVL
jgi:hypothetical protein